MENEKRMLMELTAENLSLGLGFAEARRKANARIKFLKEIEIEEPQYNTPTKGL